MTSPVDNHTAAGLAGRGLRTDSGTKQERQTGDTPAQSAKPAAGDEVSISAAGAQLTGAATPALTVDSPQQAASMAANLFQLMQDNPSQALQAHSAVTADLGALLNRR